MRNCLVIYPEADSSQSLIKILEAMPDTKIVSVVAKKQDLKPSAPKHEYIDIEQIQAYMQAHRELNFDRIFVFLHNDNFTVEADIMTFDQNNLNGALLERIFFTIKQSTSPQQLSQTKLLSIHKHNQQKTILAARLTKTCNEQGFYYQQLILFPRRKIDRKSVV